MKTIYKFSLALVCALFLNISAYSAQILVKTMPLGDGITTSGLVRVVVKVTDQHVGRDLGVVLHEESPYALSWDYGIGIMMFENLYAAVPNTAQIRGYDGTGTGAFISASGTKNITKGSKIALWFDIDIAAKTHRLVAQTDAETTPAEVYANYISRSSLKLKPSSNAKYCTVFYNDAAATAANGGQSNTAASIEVVSDAQIVTSIEAFDFSQITTGIENAQNEKLSVYPTVANDYLNIVSVEKIACAKVFSLVGQEVLRIADVNSGISISNLKSGNYILETTNVNNVINRVKFVKE